MATFTATAETMTADTLMKLDRDIEASLTKTAWLAFTRWAIANHVMASEATCWACDSGKVRALCSCPEAREGMAKTALGAIRHSEQFSAFFNYSRVYKQATATLKKLNG